MLLEAERVFSASQHGYEAVDALQVNEDKTSTDLQQEKS